VSGWRCAGPQTYSVSRGLAAESLYRAYVASTLHGGFGVSAERKGALPRRDEPGPAHYQPPLGAPCSAGPPRGRVARASANFASQSQRIKKPDQLVSTQQVIAPGTARRYALPRRRWQFDSRRIYVRPRTGPQSAHHSWPALVKLQAASVRRTYGSCAPRATAP